MGNKPFSKLIRRVKSRASYKAESETEDKVEMIPMPMKTSSENPQGYGYPWRYNSSTFGVRNYARNTPPLQVTHKSKKSWKHIEPVGSGYGTGRMPPSPAGTMLSNRSSLSERRDSRFDTDARPPFESFETDDIRGSVVAESVTSTGWKDWMKDSHTKWEILAMKNTWQGKRDTVNDIANVYEDQQRKMYQGSPRFEAEPNLPSDDWITGNDKSLVVLLPSIFANKQRKGTVAPPQRKANKANSKAE